MHTPKRSEARSTARSIVLTWNRADRSSGRPQPAKNSLFEKWFWKSNNFQKYFWSKLGTLYKIEFVSIKICLKIFYVKEKYLLKIMCKNLCVGNIELQHYTLSFNKLKITKLREKKVSEPRYTKLEPSLLWKRPLAHLPLSAIILAICLKIHQD